MQKLEYKYKKKYDEASLEFYFIGTYDKIDENVKNIIERFFEENKNPNDMITNVTILRTILRNYKEELLVVKYVDNIFNLTVKYDRTNLFYYELNTINKHGYFHMKYEVGQNLDINFTDYDDTKIIDSPYLKNELSTSLENLKSLINIKGKPLDVCESILASMYTNFYGKVPNFNSDTINEEIQRMLIILQQFGISIPYSYVFSKNELGMPYSKEIEKLLSSAYIYGVALGKFYIGENTKKKIEIIKNELLKEIIPCKISYEDLSKIIYSSGYNLSESTDKLEISHDSGCSSLKVCKTLDFIENVTNRFYI